MKTKTKKHIASNENDVSESEKEAKLERTQEIEDLKRILKTPHGIRFFQRFLIEGKVFNSTFTGNSNTFFLEGKRSLALKVFNDICEASPDKIAEIMVRK